KILRPPLAGRLTAHGALDDVVPPGELRPAPAGGGAHAHGRGVGVLAPDAVVIGVHGHLHGLDLLDGDLACLDGLAAGGVGVEVVLPVPVLVDGAACGVGPAEAGRDLGQHLVPGGAEAA